MLEKLQQGAERLELNLTLGQYERLELYIDSVLEFNKTYNLMKADSADELAVNHILDSLAAVPFLKDIVSSYTGSSGTVSIGDIGSGGGCPGIPLAVAFPDVHFTLVERMEKRCAFLESVLKRLKLSNASVLCSQADNVPKESFDIEVFRAFHPFDKKIVKTLFSMLKDGGTVAAYKARSEKIAAEMEAVKSIIPSYKKIALTVPFLEDHERNLVVIVK
ncbi:MAG: 16S rRNA (guanine(527)-N(7))-methyltransferase RsmG [Treponema sp.]|nr:16S rRNA (guanine(527)-N(7))-methyltransferase RsmG [Treponema sp.]